MLNLLCAILSSALVSILMRLSSTRIKENVSMLAMNYVMCLIVSALQTGVTNLFPAHQGTNAALGMGVFNGVLYLGSFVLLQLNVKRNGVVLSSIFMKLGLMVPMVLSIFLFGEIPTLVQGIGFAVAVAAIILINMDSGKSATPFKAGLILLLVAGGLGDAMSKVFEQYGAQELSGQFLFYTFGMALVLCTVLMLVRGEKPGWREAVFGALIGIPNFFSAKFLLAALGSIPAVIVYPTFSVGTILVVTLAGIALFREKLNLRQWIASGIILVSLVLLNI